MTKQDTHTYICIYVCIHTCMDECMDGWMDAWVGGWADAWIHRCTDGCMEGWLDDVGRTDAWMYAACMYIGKQVCNIYIYIHTYVHI